MPSRSRRNTTDDTTSRFDCRGGRLVPVAGRRLRADPLAPAARALCAALAAHGIRAARPLGLARRAQHDRRLVRSRDLSPGDPRCGRRALHPPPAAALLDGDLAPVGPEHDPGAAAGAAPATAGPRGCRGGTVARPLATET